MRRDPIIITFTLIPNHPVEANPFTPSLSVRQTATAAPVLANEENEIVFSIFFVDKWNCGAFTFVFLKDLVHLSQGYIINQ